MFINGEHVDALDGQTFEVINPANGHVIANVPLGGRADVLGVAGQAPQRPAGDEHRPQRRRAQVFAERVDGPHRRARLGVEHRRDLVHRRTNLRPAGLKLSVGSQEATAPFTREVIVGSANSITANSPQALGTSTYTVASWSDGGAQTHNIVAPATATWLWVILAGLGPLMFPLAMILINLRTRTHQGSAALSGFTQGVGYTIGATGPLLLGLLHELSGAWTLPLLLGIALGLIGIPGAIILARPGTLEDDLARIDTAKRSAR